MTQRDLLLVDNQALSYAGKVIPIRNIAYFEKFEIKKPYGTVSLYTLIPTAILTMMAVPSSKRDPIFLVPLIAGFVVWLVAMFILNRGKTKYVLILQTTAGDAPRLFEAQDESFLDRIIEQLKLRLSGNENLHQ
jgi:hypothetical protein